MTRKGGEEMNRLDHFTLMAFVLFVSLLLGSHAYAKNPASSARAIDPLVSTDWLLANSKLENLVILDVRGKKDFLEGHIPNAINVPFEVPVSEWIISKNDLLLELPEQAALFNTIGACGVNTKSLVVIVTTVANPPDPPYPLANATRVADTLIYAGVKNVAILDGGYPKWKKEGKTTSTQAPSVNKAVYQSKTNKAMFVSREYVQKHIGKSLLIDARDADVYFGVMMEPFANKAGHIPSAKSLPAPWMWKPDGTFRDTKMLRAIASGVIGKDKAKEIIVYCGVGGYASSWWFVLTQVLGYPNVKIYDGAAQEWVRYHDMVPYHWN
jgi:thiosulfate/3-mercaptopyruvate sulfurtransferase